MRWPLQWMVTQTRLPDANLNTRASRVYNRRVEFEHHDDVCPCMRASMHGYPPRAPSSQREPLACTGR